METDHFLVQRVLCKYSRSEQAGDSGIYQEPDTRGYDNGWNQYEGAKKSI